MKRIMCVCLTLLLVLPLVAVVAFAAELEVSCIYYDFSREPLASFSALVEGESTQVIKISDVVLQPEDLSDGYSVYFSGDAYDSVLVSSMTADNVASSDLFGDDGAALLLEFIEVDDQFFGEMFISVPYAGYSLNAEVVFPEAGLWYFDSEKFDSITLKFNGVSNGAPSGLYYFSGYPDDEMFLSPLKLPSGNYFVYYAPEGRECYTLYRDVFVQVATEGETSGMFFAPSTTECQEFLIPLYEGTLPTETPYAIFGEVASDCTVMMLLVCDESGEITGELPMKSGGYIVFERIPEEMTPSLFDKVTTAFNDVIAWVSTVTTSLLSGELNPLLALLAVPIAISLIFVAIKAIKMVFNL